MLSIIIFVAAYLALSTIAAVVKVIARDDRLERIEADTAAIRGEVRL